MKSISTINPAITENTDGMIVKARAPVIDINVGVLVALTRCIITLCFASRSSNVWLPFQAKNNVTSAPVSTGLTKVSHRSHYTCTANRHLCGKGERNGIQRRTKVSFGRTMIQAMELLRLAKRHISGRSDIEQ